MSNEPIDYFKAEPDDYPVLLGEREYQSNRVDRTVEVFVDHESRPLTIDDAAAAIAGVIHLWRHPDEDLHGYIRYVDEALSFLNGVWRAEQVAEQIAAPMTQEQLDADLYAALDTELKGYWEGDAPAAVEEKRPRSLEEILGS